MALGSTQHLAEMSTRIVYWRVLGKGVRCIGLTTLPPSCADCLEIWEPQPSGILWVSNRHVHGLLYLLQNHTFYVLLSRSVFFIYGLFNCVLNSCNNERCRVVG
jgi:hypothetical protein